MRGARRMLPTKPFIPEGVMSFKVKTRWSVELAEVLTEDPQLSDL